ncbi:4-hydroxyphenylacetate 3-hydroxylase N-terminal domain-containing protein [Neobacillus niacini]|uniref:4-hydroxyphenylacetate 3-hydroxylase N-terminal domain-containing protein n=1 Tax=Neobacillus niacini TaxID=86668 RepID=UPI00300353E6
MSEKAKILPFTGKEYLESLRDGREVWIYGEKVSDVTTHPAFRNAARSIARQYDALHDPEKSKGLITVTDTGNGGFTHRFFKIPRSVDDLVKSRDAIANWARYSYGWMGRSPDYKGSIAVALGANPNFWGEYNDNAVNWYKKIQEKNLYLNHALVNPPVDRSLAPDEAGEMMTRVVKETDAGVYVSGAKVVATNSALTNVNFLGNYSTIPIKENKKFALFAMIPMDAPGLKLICRPSYEMTAAVLGSPFDYPLSSRFDENDAVLIMDNVFIPWENVLLYGNIENANSFFPRSGFANRYALHGCTRLAVKLEFIAGAFLKGIEAGGTKDFRGVQAAAGEVLSWKNLLWGLSDAMAKTPDPWHRDVVQPNLDYALSYRVIGSTIIPRVKEIIENTIASGLIYTVSSSYDLLNPELEPYISMYYKGSNGYNAEDKLKIMKLLWDAVGTEFGSRHELYERNYAGNSENIRMETLFTAMATGDADRLKGHVDQFMSEYDINGWTVPDLMNPNDVNIIFNKLKQPI